MKMVLKMIIISRKTVKIEVFENNSIQLLKIFKPKHCISFLSGGSPYPGVNGRDVAYKLKNGYRMPKPKHVDQKL